MFTISKNLFNDFLLIFNENNIKMIIAVFVFFCCDFLTGFSNAVKNKCISSSKLRSSCTKFLQYFALIIVGVVIDYVFNLKYATNVICIWLITIEFTSINENCNKNGLNLPNEIKKIFSRKDGGG